MKHDQKQDYGTAVDTSFTSFLATA